MAMEWKKYSLNEITCRMLNVDNLGYPAGEGVYHKFNNDHKGLRNLECKILVYQTIKHSDRKNENFYWHLGNYAVSDHIPADVLKYYAENLKNKDCSEFFAAFRDCPGFSAFVCVNQDEQEQIDINHSKSVLKREMSMDTDAKATKEAAEKVEFVQSLKNIQDGNGSFNASGKILVEWLAELEPVKFAALVNNVKEVRTLKRQKELEDSQKIKSDVDSKYKALLGKDAYQEQEKFLKARNSDWFEYLKFVAPDGLMKTTDEGSYKDSVWQRVDQKWGRKPKWLIEKFKDISTPEQVEKLFVSKDIRPLGRLILPERAS